MKPLVSILIPAYNAGPWIGDTIKSALNQTWPRKEIIVIDDGSRDETVAIARQFTSNDVTVISQENQGASAARNKALQLCQGDYIQWLDADDLLAPDKIQRQMAVPKDSESKLRLISCEWGYFMYRPKKAQFVPSSLWCDLSPLEWLLRKWEENLHMQTATWLVSRELTSAAGPWDKRLLVDNDGEYFFRIVRSSDGVQFVFYPNRPDLVREAQQLAATLGGRLSPPKASWKYAWIERLFGFAAAKRTQVCYNQCKSSALRTWDKMMYSFEGNGSLPS